MSDSKIEKVSTRRKPPRAGMGRPPGSGNKNTTAIKDMIEQALSESGGKDYLKRQAIDNPAAFMGLVGKILPKDINHGGQPGNPIEMIRNLSDVELDERINAILKGKVG